MGAGLTVVVIHQNGRPQFVRTIGSGGNAVTAAIASSLDLPLADAEALKRRLNEPAPQVDAAQQAIRSTVDNLINEIRNSVQYFATLPDRLPVSQVLVTGGGSSLHGFIPMLGAQIHLPVHSVSPLARLNLSKVDLTPDQVAQVSPVLSTPIGLGLPESNPTVKQFNLLPPEIIHRTRINNIQQRTLLVAAVIVALLGIFGVWKLFQVHSAQNDVSTLNSDISSLNAQIPKYDLVVSADTAYQQGTARRTAVLGAVHRLAECPLQPDLHHAAETPGAIVCRHHRKWLGDRVDHRGGNPHHRHSGGVEHRVPRHRVRRYRPHRAGTRPHQSLIVDIGDRQRRRQTVCQPRAHLDHHQ